MVAGFPPSGAFFLNAKLSRSVKPEIRPSRYKLVTREDSAYVFHTYFSICG